MLPYEHLQDLHVYGFIILSTIPLLAHPFYLKGKKRAQPVLIQLTNEREARLTPQQFGLVASYHEFFIGGVMRMPKLLLEEYGDTLFLLPLLTSTSTTPLSHAESLTALLDILPDLMQRVPALPLLHNILQQATPAPSFEELRASDYPTGEGGALTVRQRVRQAFNGRIAFTPYNNVAHVICDVDFGSSPRNTFTLHTGDTKTLGDYFTSKWNLPIQDLSQPLLVANHSDLGAAASILPTRLTTPSTAAEPSTTTTTTQDNNNNTQHNISGGRNMLLPELCEVTGVVYEMISFKLIPYLFHHLHQVRLFFLRMKAFEEQCGMTFNDRLLMKQVK